MPSSASAPTETYPPSLHDALPIFCRAAGCSHDTLRRLAARDLIDLHQVRIRRAPAAAAIGSGRSDGAPLTQAQRAAVARITSALDRSEEHTSELQSLRHLVCRLLLRPPPRPTLLPYTTLFRSSAERRVAATTRCGAWRLGI